MSVPGNWLQKLERDLLRNNGMRLTWWLTGEVTLSEDHRT
jgi:hypothetical protein